MKVTWPSVIDAPLDDFMWVGSDFLTPFVLYSMDYDIYDIWNLVPDVWVQSRLLQILEVANLHGYYDMICLGCGPQLDHEDLEQLDEFDLEEMDLKWQVAMISMRLKKFYKKTGRRLQFDAKEPVGFDKTKEIKKAERRDAGNTGYRAKDNGRRPGKQEEPKALVTLDGEGVDWTGHAEDEQENFALMAYSNSGSDTEENIRFMKIDLDDKTDVLTYHKKLLAEAVKEKEELKTKVENFQSSSKGLSKLLNSQMCTRDESGLGYGNQIHEGVLSYEKEVLESVFDSRSSDVEDSLVHDRFANVEGMHAVPPPMTGNYMPSGPDREVDDSMFTYGLKQSKTSESDTQTSNFDSCESNSSVETLESVPEPVVVEPKVCGVNLGFMFCRGVGERERDGTMNSRVGYLGGKGTDISKITRKPSKTGKHGHVERKSTKEAKDSKPKPRTQSQSQEKSTLGQFSLECHVGRQGSTKEAGFCTNCSHKRSTYVSITDCQAGNPCEFICDPRATIHFPMIEEMEGSDSKECGLQGRPRRLSLRL
ncbi:hypothetical protein Tco_0543913 [Tanacetum coccineum]